MSYILELQPPEINSSDCYVTSSSPSTSYGNSIFLRVGKDVANSIAYSFIKCDLSQIPQGAIIEKASIKLYCYQGNTKNQYAIHEATSSWNELMNWSNMATFNSTIYALYDMQFQSGQWYEFDITTLVQDWHLGKKANNGIVLKSVSSISVSQITFYSSAYTAESWLVPKYFYQYRPAERRRQNPLINNSIGGALTF